ncbi:hemerythrin domain-containing protein [Acidithiobacillus sp. IBUN Pt1247-S3]|uniref:hemerythrin domain-containing protein n=1 Tax=Acidithiobacillus sp. IBUN Pt1247-S3 TaxID=3166642 RepID=UPI0034E4D6FE
MTHAIQDIMQHDHERLDKLLAETEIAVEKGHWQEAETLFQGFRKGIVGAHMTIEEYLLFPAFERWSQDEQHPLTALLRKGHQDLRVFFAEIEDSLQQHDTEEFADLLSTVQIILKQHDAKEESELYPYLDEALPGQGDFVRQKIAAAQE